VDTYRTLVENHRLAEDDDVGKRVAWRAPVVGLDHVEQKWKKLLPRKSNSTPANKSTCAGKQGGGGGFGGSAKNRKVEAAAVRKVTKDFQHSAWEVESVEKQRIGFDLLCVKGDQTKKVEVKGVSGGTPSFIRTAGELRASDDDQFELRVVLNALSKSLRSAAANR
jgi:hypothetical protein